jgi:hypothetical protein
MINLNKILQTEITISPTDHLKEMKCWKGYKKVGTKLKGGKRVNDCVKIKKKK